VPGQKLRALHAGNFTVSLDSRHFREPLVNSLGMGKIMNRRRRLTVFPRTGRPGKRKAVVRVSLRGSAANKVFAISAQEKKGGLHE
jgi:hypothetical protein